MKKIIIIFGITAALIFTFSSCYYDHGSIRGFGQSVETEIKVDYITGIELNGSMDIEIIPSDTFKVFIVAQENITSLMIIETIGGIAKIKYRPRINIIPTDVAKVVFYMPELHSITQDGSGNIYVLDEYEQNSDMQIKINGSGNIKINSIICDKLKTTISGSGNIETKCISSEIETIIRGSGNIHYSGSARIHTVRISGSGDLDAFDLLTDSTFIDISGSGDAYVWAEYFLDIHISGSGNITYKGDPALYYEISGSGHIIRW